MAIPAKCSPRTRLLDSPSASAIFGARSAISRTCSIADEREAESAPHRAGSRSRRAAPVRVRLRANAAPQGRDYGALPALPAGVATMIEAASALPMPARAPVLYRRE